MTRRKTSDGRAEAAPAPLSLEEAMAGAAAGDASAFEHVYAEARGGLVRALRRTTGDETLAEDVAQDTFLKLWLARATYQVGMPVMPWLRAIARRTLIDALRRARTERDAQAYLKEPCDESDPRVEAVIDARRESTRVLAAISLLPPKQAQAIYAAATDGPTLADVAKRAGDTPLALRLRVHRARAALRKSACVSLTE